MSPSCRWGVPKGCSAKTSSCTPTRTHRLQLLHPDQLWKVVSTLSRLLK